MTNTDARLPALAAVRQARADLDAGTRASSQRRTEIVAISAQLFADRGYKGTTIRDIAERADILSGSLYHHFESKESIIDEIICGYWTDLFEKYEKVLSTEASGSAQIREMVGLSIRMLERHGAAIRILLNDYPYVAEALPYVEDLMAVLERVWTDMLTAGIERGDLRPDLDVVLVYRTIMSAISGTGRWFDPSGPISIDQVTTAMQELLLDGIAAR
jgi:TetR/AcrR family transcriptional regulator, cholesterol catabolism regulator